MRINKIKNALISVSVIILSIFSITSNAQNELKNSVIESNFHIQPNVGISQYYGDLNKMKYWNQHPRFAFGVNLSYQIHPIFGIRGQFMKTNLYSERADQNLAFSSNLWNGSVNLLININKILTKYVRNYNENIPFDFNLYTGAGISSFKSKLNNQETGELLNEHSNWQNEFSLPIGAGIIYKINDNFSISVEYCDHTIFGGTKLDFTDKSKQNNDHFSYASAGLQIRLGVKDTDHDGVSDKYDLCPKLYGRERFAGCPDNDNDGVADKDDACPDVAGNSENKGCPDRDGDGIIDREDDCPTERGKLLLHGCPDKDGDGTADKDDKCPEVPGKVELAGCPDRDGDGVADKDDVCPDMRGTKQMNGCPDQDEDGIADKDDKCPDVRGRKEFAGCPDSDGDGVTDSQDSCKYIAGKKEFAGCPDRDGDGVADNRDDCPDKKGLSKFSGCPDTDGDGIPDNKDDCPGTAGVVSNKGCPKMTKTTEKTILSKIVYFDPGSFTVIPTFRNILILDEIVTYMKANPNSVISITGYEDANEAEYKSFHLSEKRVDYVINYLKQKGVNPSKIKKSYLGKKNPVADNNSEQGRTLNRRVEIKITK